MYNAQYATFSFSYTSYFGYSFSYFKEACGVECN